MLPQLQLQLQQQHLLSTVSGCARTVPGQQAGCCQGCVQLQQLPAKGRQLQQQQQQLPGLHWALLAA
jgi:hypothetical protein